MCFPFKYKNKVYHNCSWDPDSLGGPWCSTLVDDLGQHAGGDNWGICRANCPTESKLTTVDNSTCSTVRGPTPNVPCVFPFIFRGIVYNNCSWAGDSTGGAWCSTLVSDSGHHVSGRHWGNCGPNCPIPEKPKGK